MDLAFSNLQCLIYHKTKPNSELLKIWSEELHQIDTSLRSKFDFNSPSNKLIEY